jgi:hypothetical protein
MDPSGMQNMTKSYGLDESRLPGHVQLLFRCGYNRLAITKDVARSNVYVSIHFHNPLCIPSPCKGLDILGAK